MQSNILLFKFFYWGIRGLSFVISLMPRRRRYIVFLGHNGAYSGNARYLFESYCEKHKQSDSVANLKPVFVVESLIDKSNDGYLYEKSKSKLGFWKLLFLSKVCCITTPGDSWVARDLLCRGNRILLLSNGTPLKSAGVLSKNFSKEKKVKYRYFWKNISHIVVGSTFEKYLASSTLGVAPERIQVLGAARQFKFDPSTFNESKEKNRKIILERYGLPEGSRLVLYAPTQRAYKSDFGQTDMGILGDIDRFELQSFGLFLEKNNIYLFKRFHSLASNKETQISDKRIIEFSSASIPDVNEYISAFDFLISDYSGIYLDLLALPIKLGLIRVSDDDFVGRRGLILPDKFLNVCETISSIESLCQFLVNAQNSEIMVRKKMLRDLFFEVPEDKCLENNMMYLTRLAEG